MSKQRAEKRIVKFHTSYGAYNAGETSKVEPHIAKSLCGEGGVANDITEERKAKALEKAKQDKALRSPSEDEKQQPKANNKRPEPKKTVAK